MYILSGPLWYTRTEKPIPNISFKQEKPPPLGAAKFYVALSIFVTQTQEQDGRNYAIEI